MRKLSILAMVVIFAGAMTVGVNAAQDSATSNVTFQTNSSITLNVTEGNQVDFGDTLDPNATHYKTQATKLAVESNTEWTISYSKTGSAKSSLTVGLGSPSTSYGTVTWDSVQNGPSSFNSYLSNNYGGSNDESGINVSYMLNDLKQLQEGTEHSVTVAFTATTQ